MVLSLALTACGSGSGPDIQDFLVTNLQVVQGVQTFANTMPLVAYKPTFVRISLRSNEASHGPWKVTARLNVLDTATLLEHDLLPISLDPDHAITVSPSGSHPDRWDDSFTFVLDYGDTSPGDRVFTVRAFSGPDEPTPPSDHVRSYQMRFHPRVAKSVYGLVFAETELDPAHVEVPIGPAAPWSDFEGHRRYVENAFPVAHFGVLPLPGIGTVAPSPQPFTTITGANSWADLMVKNMPPGTMLNILMNWDLPGSGGFAFGSISEEENDRGSFIGTTMAQEVAHTFGLWCHTFDPCGGSTFPRPSGAIDPQDLGFNVSGNYGHALELVTQAGQRDLLGPLSALAPISDFMSYESGGLWVSSFTYCQLVELLWSASVERICVPGVRRATVEPRAAAVPGAVQRYLYVLGTQRTDGTASLDALEELPSRTDISTPDGLHVSHVVRLRDATGTVLLSHPFGQDHSDHDAGAALPFSVVIPFEAVREAATVVELLDSAGNPLAQRTLPTQEPVVGTLTDPAADPGTGFVSGRQTISWSADDPAGRSLRFTLLYSPDGGATWWPMNTRLTGTSADVDFDSLPGSDAALLKVRASNDGRSTERVTATPFRVGRRPIQVSILDPADGAAVDARVPLLLQGRAFTWEDGDLVDPDAFTWSTDAGPVGMGPWLVLRSLTPGPLAVTLLATAPDGRTARTTVHLTVVPGG